MTAPGAAVVKSRWQLMRGTFYDAGPGRLVPPGVDCSGSIKWANSPCVPGLPDLSWTTALWAIDNGLVIPVHAVKPWDLMIYGKGKLRAEQGYSSNGHIEQKSDTPGKNWGSSGSHNGVGEWDTDRLDWDMGVDMSDWLGHPDRPQEHKEMGQTEVLVKYIFPGNAAPEDAIILVSGNLAQRVVRSMAALDRIHVRFALRGWDTTVHTLPIDQGADIPMAGPLPLITKGKNKGKSWWTGPTI